MFCAAIISAGASAQTIKQNIDKAIKDKNVKENSAKADVVIQKKVITDTTLTKTSPTKAVSKTNSASKHNKGKYKVKHSAASK